MAVFTKLNQKEINKFVDTYNIGKLDQYSEILEGIENTNYKIVCNNKPYILTIFEKRVRNKDLPFFMDLKLYLNKNKFKCPKPVKNKNKEIINSIKNKKGVIISFIEGKKITKPSSNSCFEVGKMIGKLHKVSVNFKKKRRNTLSLIELNKLFKQCKRSKKNKKFSKLINTLNNEIEFLVSVPPMKLPSGIVHADLFMDNIFFKNKKISGVIDFYFSCDHFLLYDIAIAINEWCFKNNGKDFQKDFFKSLIKGYNKYRKLKVNEMRAFNTILRIAAVRILVTRLYDYIFHQKNAVVVKKDPIQYLNILKWHQRNYLS